MPKQGSGTVNYPGGKTTIADWVIDHFPKHECYVEPFGGSASVLFNKPRSTVEVYNDAYGRVVNFFRMCRDRPDELREWVDSLPYSRRMYEEFVADMRAGDEPEDPIERAGRFFYIQTSSFSAKPQGGGFRINTTARSPADEITHKFEKSKNQIDRIADRFREVVIEDLDYADAFDKYDGDDTLFYADPPYVGDHNGNTYYMVGDDFDHDRFVDVVRDADGFVIISYDDLPDVLADLVDGDDWFVSERGRKYSSSMGAVKDTERLVSNFDPSSVPGFGGANQSGVDEFI